MVHKCFLDYSSYNYQRMKTYRNLPYPAYIPVEAPLPGWFEYLALYARMTKPTGDPLFHIHDARILPTVWPDPDPEADTQIPPRASRAATSGASPRRPTMPALSSCSCTTTRFRTAMRHHRWSAIGEHQTAYDVSIDATIPASRCR